MSLDDISSLKVDARRLVMLEESVASLMLMISV